jgi:hypothetical protein
MARKSLIDRLEDATDKWGDLILWTLCGMALVCFVILFGFFVALMVTFPFPVIPLFFVATIAGWWFVLSSSK